MQHKNLLSFLGIFLIIIILLEIWIIYSINTKNEDKFSSSIEQEEFFLEQKQKTYDSFLSSILVYLSIFTIILMVAGFFGYREIKKKLQEDMDIKTQKFLDNMAETAFESRISAIEERLEEVENNSNSTSSRSKILKKKKVPISKDINKKVENLFD